MKTVFIYALKCPLTGQIRYIGKANNPRIRLYHHISEAAKDRHHRACWIRSLAAQGLEPTIEIIDEVSDLEWPMWEAAYIQFYKEAGCDLTNFSDGGECGPILRGEKHPFYGKNLPPATCAKISAAKLGVRHSPERRECNRVAQTGKKLSPETCAKMSVNAKRGKEHPWFGKPGTRLGCKHVPGQTAKISAAQIGKKKKNNRSGFVGVSQHAGGKWIALFRVAGRQIYVGLFSKIEDAVFARALAVALQ